MKSGKTWWDDRLDFKNYQIYNIWNGIKSLDQIKPLLACVAVYTEDVDACFIQGGGENGGWGCIKLMRRGVVDSGIYQKFKH